MSMNFRLNQSDRLLAYGKPYRCAEATETGYIFVAEDDPHSTLAMTVDDLGALLQTEDATLDRGYYEPGPSRSRLDAPCQRLQDLEQDIRNLTLWRHAYVLNFLELEIAKKVKRTAKSTKAVIPEIKNRIAATNNLKSTSSGKRAGRKQPSEREAPSASTLLTWVRRYERAGHDVRALVPRTHRSGNTRNRFCIISEKLISDTIQFYASFQRPSIRAATKKCLDAFKSKNRERTEHGLAPLEPPSKRTIARRIGKLDSYSVYAQRFGAEAANRKFAHFEDGVSASFPMERIEIDEWNVDVITVLRSIGVLDGLSDEVVRSLEQKRLWLYLAIDCATRCVVAMHLCESMNATDAIRALAFATRDKTDLALAAGCKSPWHHGGGFGSVYTDQGAGFVEEIFQCSVLDLGGLIATPPAGIPRLRGRVERIFRTFGTQLMPMLAGRTFSNPQDRGDYPSEKLAVHTKESLMRVLTLHVVDVYHNTPHRGLMGETPANCWTRLAKEKGVIPPPSAQQRCAVFGIKETRKITGSGVRVLGIDYANALLQDMHKRAPGSRIKISINPENLGWLLVWTGSSWIVAKAVQRSFDGVSLGQWRLASRELRLRFDQQAEINEAVIDRALRKIEDINAEQMRVFDVTIPFMTPDDLKREERQLHLGLTIRPEEQPKLDLPDAGEMPGAEVPLPDQAPDLFNSNATPPPSKLSDPDQGNTPASKNNDTKDWGMEDDQ